MPNKDTELVEQGLLSVASDKVFMDIEPPLAPNYDWGVWSEALLWFGLVCLLVWLVVKWGHMVYRPAYLRWELRRLQAAADRLTAEKNGAFSEQSVWLLYGWCLRLHRFIIHSPHSSFEKQQLETLMKKVSQLGFSSSAVSRETYLECIALAQVVVSQRFSWSRLAQDAVERITDLLRVLYAWRGR